ncbi:MAG: hypothetical protein CHACPFDD_02985 [Phycisphaerae bacterium]|nr:hypothetical protein [Phycisphaerae bacterium]
MLSERTILCLFPAALLALSALAHAQIAEPHGPLLTPVAAPDGANPLPQARSFMAATVDRALLAGCEAGSAIRLDLAPGRPVTARARKVERHPDRSYSVFGTLDGLAQSSFILVVVEDAVAADILCPMQKEHYRFKYAGNGVHLVCEMNDEAYAPCGGSVPPPAGMPVEDFFPEADENDDPPGEGPTAVCSDVETVFDAMVVYSDVARAAAGGTNAIHAEIQLAVDRTNESYANSPIFARYRLLWREEVAYDEVGSYGDHLSRLTSGGSAPWTDVRALRDAINADFCTLWVDDGEFCGLAHCTASNSSAYSVVTWSCAAGNLSHPHEVGHNQGCDHDPDNGGGCGAFSYSFGHRFFGNDSNEYRTVMAYAPGSRIPYFSNPNATFLGTPTGTASRDNTRTINERRSTCAAFQATRYDIWVDFPFGGSESGTFSNPYNTITEGIANIDAPGFGASELPNLYIKAGTTGWTGTISTGMRVSPCGGIVRIGG